MQRLHKSKIYLFGLFALFFIYNTYAKECEVVECTFTVSGEWHELLTGQACPKFDKFCDTKFSWKICKYHITSPFGIVDEKDVIMKDGFIKKMMIKKSVGNETTIYHILEKKSQKITLFSRFERDEDHSDLATKPLNTVANECDIEYIEEAIDTNDVTNPVVINHKTGANDDEK